MILKDQFAQFEKHLADVTRLAAQYPDEDGLYNKLIAHLQKLTGEARQALSEIEEPVRTEDVKEPAEPVPEVPAPPKAYEVGDPLDQGSVERAIQSLLSSHPRKPTKAVDDAVTDESIRSEWDMNLGQAPGQLLPQKEYRQAPQTAPKETEPKKGTEPDDGSISEWE